VRSNWTSERVVLCHKLDLNWREPGTRGCTCTLTSVGECCREVTSGGLSGQGQRVRSSEHAYKIAARESSIPETRGNVLGTSAERRARDRSTFENDRENEPDMTTYPLEFHRRSEQKWVFRSQREQRRASESERRDVLAQMPLLREIGQCLRAGYDAVGQPIPERLVALLKEFI
jgi:hypothetical protein